MAFSNLAQPVAGGQSQTQGDLVFVVSPWLNAVSRGARLRRILFVALALVVVVAGAVGIYLKTQLSPSAATYPTYTAVAPGKFCDTGAGSWGFGPTTSVQCESTAAKVFAYGVGEVRFFGPNGVLASRYTIHVQVDLSQLAGGCAGVRIRPTVHPQSFTFVDFYVCDSGMWFLQTFDASGQAIFPASGMVASTNTKSHSLAITATESLETFMLDGNQVATNPDVAAVTPVPVQTGQYGNCDVYTSSTKCGLYFPPTTCQMILAPLECGNYLSLIESAPSESSGYALFSNFSYTPLPPPA